MFSQNTFHTQISSFSLGIFFYRTSSVFECLCVCVSLTLAVWPLASLPFSLCLASGLVCFFLWPMASCILSLATERLGIYRENSRRISLITPLSVINFELKTEFGEVGFRTRLSNVQDTRRARNGPNFASKTGENDKNRRNK